MQFTRMYDTGAFTWTANTGELTRLQKWFTVGFNRASRETDILIPLIRRFGSHTNRNFRNEMWPGAHRDWAPLTEYTQSEREERGYDPDHPILVQSGQLKRLASQPFMNWRNGQRSIRPRTETTPYGENSPLSVNATLSPGRFTATISGDRVKHQTAYSISRRDGSRTGVPPRPFWGLTKEMLDEGVSGRGTVVNQYGTGTPYARDGSAMIFLNKWYEQRRTTR